MLEFELIDDTENIELTLENNEQTLDLTLTDYDDSEVRELIDDVDNKIDELETKTDNEFNQLSGAIENLQTNKADKTQVNELSNQVSANTSQISQNKADISTLNDKVDNIHVPTKTSELTNDSGFITNTTDNLINYYKKTETYTKDEVNDLISSIESFSIQIVEELPEIGESNIIYLVPKEGSTDDVYDEYVYVNNNWEHIGSTEVDLSNYYTKTETDTLLSAKYEKPNTGIPKTDLDSSVQTSLGKADTALQEHQSLSNYYNKTETDALLDDKQDNLTAGINITIDNNIISSPYKNYKFVSQLPQAGIEENSIYCMPALNLFPDASDYLDSTWGKIAITYDTYGSETQYSYRMLRLKQNNNRCYYGGSDPNSLTYEIYAIVNDEWSIIEEEQTNTSWHSKMKFKNPTYTNVLYSNCNFSYSGYEMYPHWNPDNNTAYITGLPVDTSNVNPYVQNMFVYKNNDWNKIGQSDFTNLFNDVVDINDLNTALATKQDIIDSSHKLSSDLVDDTNQTNKFVTSTDITNWNNKADISDIPDVSGFITKDANNLTNYTLKTNTGSLIDLEINQTTYVVTLTLKDQDGNTISTDTIDLPLESVVVNGSYDSTNQKIVLTLQNGTTIDIPVGALVAGLQTEITSTNKLSSDLVDDTNSGNKFVTTSEKTTWNGKYDKPSTGIPKTDFANDVQTSLGKADSALQSITSSDVTSALGYTPYNSTNPNGYTSNTGTITSVKMNGTTISSSGEADLGTVITSHQDISGKEDKTNKVTSISSSSTDNQYPTAKCVYDIVGDIESLLSEV